MGPISVLKQTNKQTKQNKKQESLQEGPNSQKMWKTCKISHFSGKISLDMDRDFWPRVEHPCQKINKSRLPPWLQCAAAANKNR